MDVKQASLIAVSSNDRLQAVTDEDISESQDLVKNRFAAAVVNRSSRIIEIMVEVRFEKRLVSPFLTIQIHIGAQSSTLVSRVRHLFQN